MNRRTALVAGLLALLALRAPAWAFDNEQTFAKGTYVFSFEGGYGEQFNLERQREQSGVAFANVGIRAGLLPFDRLGAGALHGALELGVGPFYQHYTEPRPAFWGGAAAVARYHFLALGRLVPYAELAGAVGATDLRVREIASDFSFLVWGGVGVSVFVTDSTAVYAGYRLMHNSNGNASRPNRGWESHVGVAGVSYYFQ
jgi:opacity protein-like surface antigen